MALMTLALGAQILAGYVQNRTQKKAAGIADQQARLAARLAEMRALRDARDAVRKQRAEQARVTQLAYSAGVGSSSALAGTLGGATSSTASRLADAYQGLQYERGYGQLGVASARLGAKSQTWGAIGALGGTMFSDMGGFKTMFGGNQPAPNISSNDANVTYTAGTGGTNAGGYYSGLRAPSGTIFGQ